MTYIPATIDLGSGFTAKPFTQKGIEGTAGVIVTGPAALECTSPSDGRCGGAVPFEGSTSPGRPQWKVEQEDPLTLSPSIVCGCQGQHGFIRAGRWEPA